MSPGARASTTPLASRLRGFGTTIFTEMSALAERTGAINLGQGFPDTDGPPEVVEAAVAALRSGRRNQYAPLRGVPELREAIAAHQRHWYAMALDPETDVTVTFGATEAITAALLGLCEPGDEVLCLEPYYDSYAAAIAMAGGVRRPVTLRPPEFALDTEALRAMIVPGRTRLLLLNSPHNPTGRVLRADELAAVAEACVEHDLIAVSDEVYEHLVFDGEHVPLATLPGMAERTLTISSVGKSFSFTGWKVGWACGPADLVATVAAAKQFLSFAGGTPLQHAAAVALQLPDHHVHDLATELGARRDRLCDGLRAAGFDPIVPQGTYFTNVDVTGRGFDDGRAFCLALPERAGVVAVPTQVFYDDPDPGRFLVRFAFCKREEVIDDAAARLAAAFADAP